MTTVNKAVEHTFDCLAVTEVQVFPFKDDGNLGVTKAMSTIVLNDQLVIRGLRVKDGVNGLFVAFPLDKFYKDGELQSICFPLTRQLREHIEGCVIEKYQQAMEA